MLEHVLILISVTALVFGSPGPAPIALAATGVTYGLQKGLPLLLGQLTGLLLVIMGTSFGLARVFVSYPELDIVFHFLGAAYIVSIAYKIVTAPIHTESIAVSAPGFKIGVVLTMLNPRVYAAFFAIFSQFLLPISDPQTAFLLTGVICWLVAVSVDVLWLAFGNMLKPLFVNSNQIRMIRAIFALVMIVSVIFALL